MKHYTIIKADNCVYCQKAWEVLYDRGLPICRINIKDDPFIKTLMLKAGLTTVPQVFDPEGNLIGGYTDLVEHLNEIT